MSIAPLPLREKEEPMRNMQAPVALLSLILTTGAALADGRDNSDGMLVASESYFGVEEQQVVVLEQRGVRVEEVPVVLFLATRARVQPDAILELRLSGQSWFSIAQRYHLGADVFYVPVPQPRGPYEATYRVYSSRPRAQWNAIVLRDEDVLNLVNLKFYSEHYGCEPEE